MTLVLATAAAEVLLWIVVVIAALIALILAYAVPAGILDTMRKRRGRREVEAFLSTVREKFPVEPGTRHSGNGTKD